MNKCIDISAWQGNVSQDTFARNRASIPCVIIRSSYTTQQKFTLNKDKCWENDVKNAAAAGMNIGVYHYSQAISESEAIREAEYVLSIILPHKSKIFLPVAFDWEFGYRLSSYMAGKLGKTKCGHICDAFCRTIQKAGFKTMVYANLSTLNAYLPSDLYKRWPIWIAQYNSKCNYKHPYYMWQYTSGGKVSGISGRVDMNYLYGDVSQQPSRTVTLYQGVFPKLPKRGWFSSGDRGEEVRRLQSFLNWYGGYGLEVDGIVGRKTINAVKQFQGREKIKIDGAFGEQSLARAKSVRA